MSLLRWLFPDRITRLERRIAERETEAWILRYEIAGLRDELVEAHAERDSLTPWERIPE